MQRTINLVLALTLAACTAGPYSADYTPLRTSPAAASRPTFATQLAGPETYLPPMPTAVVILEPGDLNRNRAFCNAVIGGLPTASEAMRESTVAPNLVLTRWLVQLDHIPPGRAFDCDFLVGTYDYARADRLKRSIRLSEGRFAGRGPYLLMVIPDGSGLHVAGLDGSFVSDSGFPGFVGTWASALQQTERQTARQGARSDDQPGLVRSVFNLVSAILRTAAGATGGLLRGAIESL